MAQYRDLNAPPQQTFAEIVAAMQEQAKSSKTGASGVKDLGEAGDIVWPRPDGTAVSVRDVDLDLADARQRIEDAEGDLAGAQARIDTALDAEGHIREDEILRNATLLGETVVQEINVTDKLVGTDGVFTGTVDFANVNVTGELLANEISGEYLYGTVIEGGEIRTGSDESRGSFLLGDRAYVSPIDGYTAPGIQFEAPNQEYAYPAGLGLDSRAVSVSSGRTADGRYGQLQVNPGGVSAVVSPAPGDTAHWGSRFSVDNTRARLSAGNPAAIDRAEILASGPVILNGQEVSNAAVLLEVRHNGKLSRVEAGGGTTVVEASDGTTKRSLRIDSSGVWVMTNKSGVMEAWNLEETANDTGWINFTLRPGISGTGSPALRLKGGMVYFRGTLTRSGSWAQGWTEVAGPFNPRYRPETTMQFPGAITDDRRTLLRMGADGILSIYMSASIAGTATVPLNPLSYVLG